MQRYHCGACDYYFTIDSGKQTAGKKSVKHHATIIDLAKQLNISKSTVSRALRGSSDISNQTKEAVLKLARKINYIPNHFAYSLAKKSSSTIGIIVPELISNFFPQFIIAAQEAATAAGYKVVICHSNESVDNEVEISKMLFANQVDGVLLSMSRETKDLNHLKIFQTSGIPVILYNRMISKSRFVKVVADDYDGAFKGVEHLIKNGLQTHCPYCRPAGVTNQQQQAQRLQGCLAQTRLAGR
jgi:DNA-binding LacI/PurR family transcriptional regulator